MKLITIIPAYNEEKAIESVVQCALKYCDVLVVDDGSTDNTYNLAKNAGARVIRHEKNKGQGAAIKSGLKEALNGDYDIFIVLDGDGQHDPIHIPLLTSSINDAGLIIGSRFKKGMPSYMPVSRRLSNKITTNLIGYVTGYELTDSQSGFKAIQRDAARFFLDTEYNDFVYASETIYKASENNIKVKEIDIPCKYGDEKSYVTKIHVLRYVLFIVRILGRKFKIRVTNGSLEIKRLINNI